MMKKVLLIQGSIPHYRVPVFNKLNDVEDVELTIVHSGKRIPEEQVRFKQIIVPCFFFLGFKWQKQIFSLSNNFDVIIARFDLYWLSSLFILFFRRCKFIYWGIGKGRKRIVNLLRRLLYHKIDALVLYSNNDANYFSTLENNKIFVANNTLSIQNSRDYSSSEKNSFIFVGTLYKGKGMEDLLFAFSELKNSPYKLVIVGDGEMKSELISLSKKNQIENKIEFKGFINDNDILAQLYSEAICSISPRQAGLSVLQSMAFGVPFITSRDAYSGGEKFNIVDNSTGLFYDNDGLLTAMQKIVDNEVCAREMGHNAYEHFVNNRSVENMVSGFVDSINFVTKKSD